ncbi:hypothetical protein BJ322DRAFT_1020493 [Thelephora terrestris]|uniref:Uncharacterized protein n=1 Tax=Thelephora terrestris TaxID=56493 RepID=A0A9P6HG64_9AGAM|nr:hypothetical protein BJ322DRAFT_1020493 [Thelephora terrestris]
MRSQRLLVGDPLCAHGTYLFANLLPLARYCNCHVPRLTERAPGYMIARAIPRFLADLGAPAATWRRVKLAFTPHEFAGIRSEWGGSDSGFDAFRVPATVGGNIKCQTSPDLVPLSPSILTPQHSDLIYREVRSLIFLSERLVCVPHFVGDHRVHHGALFPLRAIRIVAVFWQPLRVEREGQQQLGIPLLHSLSRERESRETTLLEILLKISWGALSTCGTIVTPGLIIDTSFRLLDTGTPPRPNDAYGSRLSVIGEAELQAVGQFFGGKGVPQSNSRWVVFTKRAVLVSFLLVAPSSVAFVGSTG